MKRKKASAKAVLAIGAPPIVNIRAENGLEKVENALKASIRFYPRDLNLKRIGKDRNYAALSFLLAKDHVAFHQIPAQVFADILEYLFFNYLLMFQFLRGSHENVGTAFFNSKQNSRVTDLRFLENYDITLPLPGQALLDSELFDRFSLNDSASGAPLLSDSLAGVEKQPGDQVSDEFIFTRAGIYRFEAIFRKISGSAQNVMPVKVVVTPVTNSSLFKWFKKCPSMPLNVLYKLKNQLCYKETELMRNTNHVQEQIKRVVGVLHKISRHQKKKK